MTATVTTIMTTVKKVSEEHRKHEIKYYHRDDKSITVDPFCVDCGDFVPFTYEEI